MPQRTLPIVLAVLACAGLVLWAGLSHYRRTSGPEEPATTLQAYCDERPDWKDCYEAHYASLQGTETFAFAPATAAAGVVTRHLRTRYTFQNLESRGAERFDLWCYLPAAGIGGQHLVGVKLSQPGKLAADSVGNRIVLCTFRDLAPFETRILEVLVSVLLTDMTDPVGLPPSFYLSEERLVEVGHPEVAAVAATLRGPTPVETARSVFQWVRQHARPLGFDGRDHGALWALRNGAGDCTEMAFLFTALCRACGIAARTLTGYVTDRDRVVGAQDVHNWAEFYEQGRWHLADPYYGQFKTNAKDRVGVEIFRGEHRNPMGEYHGYRFEGYGARFKVKKG